MRQPLSPTAIMLTAVLSKLTPVQAARVTNTTLGKRLGVHPRTIGRALSDLTQAGYLRIDRRPPNLAGPGTDPTGRTFIWLGAPKQSLDAQIASAVGQARELVEVGA